MKEDPCFRCILPDCDDASSACMVRRLALRCDYKSHNGRADEITPAEREARNRYHEIWKLERYALAAEGVRPFKRVNSKWTGTAEP